jgi:DNA-binding XRE family transcriptional regulator/quercetin dioxygenase-like cupin family protein
MRHTEAVMDHLGSRLKTIRLKAGWTLRELARQAGVSPSFVSQIENGKSQPSVATLYEFAQLLNVSIDELFDPTGGFAPRPAGRAGRVPTPHLASLDPRGGAAERPATRGRATNGATNPSDAWHPSEYANRVSVVHPSHRSSLTMADGVIWERLAATPEHAVNFMKITYAPGATSTAGGAPVSHEGYEYGYVLKGTLEIVVGAETFTLQAGESMGFDSMIPHVLRNVGDGEFAGIWFVHGRERAVRTAGRPGAARRAAVTASRGDGVRRRARARRA